MLTRIDTPTFSRKDFRHEIALVWDGGDKWGSVMSIFWPLAAELWWRGELVPPEWGFYPGLGDDPREHDEYFFEVCEGTSTEDLLYFGKLLDRYCNFVKRAGKDY
jgi:hypothetical protein